MTALPPSSKYLQRSAEPVSDGERESLTQRLADAFADGRLPQDEYLEQLDLLYRARNLGELVPVVEKLPAPASDVPEVVGQGRGTPGTFNDSRNLMKPTLLLVGGLLLVLALLLGTLAALFFFG